MRRGEPGRSRPRPDLSHTSTAFLVAVLLMATSLGLLAPSVAASAQQEGPLPLRLAISRLTGLTGAGSISEGGTPPADVFLRVLVEHVGDDVVSDVEVVVETFSRAISRNELRLALDEGQVGRPRTVVRFPVREGEVEPGDLAAVDVFLPVDDVVQADRGGVYPLQVSLTRGTTVLDRVVTAVIHLDEVPANPLEAVAIWPIDAAPWTTPDADRTAFDASLLPGGRIDALVRGLEAAPASGVVAGVTPHLLDALVRRSATLPGADEDGSTDDAADADRAGLAAADLLARLRVVLDQATNPPVSGPYASADLDSLVDAGPQMIGIAGELAADGPRRVAGLAGREVASAVVLPRVPLSTRSLDLLPGDHLLLAWDDVLGPDLEVGPDLPHPVQRLRATSGRILTASVADPYVTRAMARPDTAHGTPVAVQRVLAETALVHFEQPGVADRPLLLLPPQDWSPSTRFARDLAVGLSRAPWMALSPADAHAQVAVGDLEQAVLPAVAPHLPTSLARDIGTTLTAVASVAQSLPNGPIVAGRTVADLDDQLRRATSHWFVDDVATAEAMVADVAEAVDRSYGTVDVPTADAITLLSEQGKIPITIRRTSGDPLDVEVEVRSRGSLSWPNGSVQRRTLAPGGTQTLSFDVLARSRGDIPVEVVVRDVSGARILADATIRVRSTFVSRPALIATGAVVVLLLLVGRLRRRPGRDPEGADPDGGGTGRDPGDRDPDRRDPDGPGPGGGAGDGPSTGASRQGLSVLPGGDRSSEASP